MTIFYFTGTGNSLFTARKIAEANDAELISIPHAITEQKSYSDDVIGFVYPQYANGLPKMVRKFIVNNTFKADYIFAVDLYSFIHFKALGEIADLIPLNYGTYLKTPNNFIFLFNSPKDPKAKIAKVEKEIERVIKDISNRASKPINPKRGIGNATKYFGESKFKLTAACTRCGTCARICPANNIKIDKTVAFENNCEMCYACVNLCPSHAIYSNSATLKRRQYKNPVISVDEIAKANAER